MQVLFLCGRKGVVVVRFLARECEGEGAGQPGEIRSHFPEVMGYSREKYR